MLVKRSRTLSGVVFLEWSRRSPLLMAPSMMASRFEVSPVARMVRYAASRAARKSVHVKRRSTLRITWRMRNITCVTCTGGEKGGVRREREETKGKIATEDVVAPALRLGSLRPMDTHIVRKIRYVGAFGFSDRWIHAHREENSLRGFALCRRCFHLS